MVAKSVYIYLLHSFIFVPGQTSAEFSSNNNNNKGLKGLTNGSDSGSLAVVRFELRAFRVLTQHCDCRWRFVSFFMLLDLIFHLVALKSNCCLFLSCRMVSAVQTHKKSFAEKKECVELNNLSQLGAQIPKQPPLYKSNS